MNRKGVVLIVLCFSFFGNLLVAQSNVVLIVADDLGINALGCYGNKFVDTPNIDQLAQEGMKFSNGYAAAPVCAPSRATIMTGQYIPRHKLYRVSDERYKSKPKDLNNMRFLPPANNRPTAKQVGISLEAITLAEHMQYAGFKTAAFGKWHCGSKDLSMGAHGFDEWVETTKHYGFKHYPSQTDIFDNEYNADYCTRKAVDFIERKVASNEKFFLYMPYYLVHKPLEPKEEYLDLFRSKYAGQLEDDNIKVVAMIKSLDDSVGQLVQSLKEQGVYDDTIIIFTSDNGHYRTENNQFNQPYNGTKGTVFDGGIRVPYIFKWGNNIKANSQSSEVITHMDLYPTIAALSESKLDESHVIDGLDISQVLLGKKSKLNREYIAWQYANYAGYNTKTKEWRSSWKNVILCNDYKLTEDVESGYYRLVNTKTDIMESVDVSVEQPLKFNYLKDLLKQWKKEVNSEQPKLNPEYSGKVKPSITKKKVFLLAGQSNMDGRADAAGISSEDLHRIKVAGEKIVFHYNHNAPRPLGPTTPAKHIQRKFSFTECFGPELFFGVELVENNPNEEYIFIKRAQGGTSLYGCWNSNWSIEKATLVQEENQPKLYEDFIAYTYKVLSTLDTSEYEIEAMLWVQGEDDSSKKYGLLPSQSYYDNLYDLIEGVRDEFNKPHLPFIMFQVGHGEVVNAMKKLSEEDEQIILIPQSKDKGSDHYFEKNPPPIGHYNTKSMKQIGYYFYQYYKEYIR